MKNEEMEKDAVVAGLDQLTDKQLEAVLGGFVIDGKTYTTVFAASTLTLPGLSCTAFCGDAGVCEKPFNFSGGTCLGQDSAGSSVYTVDNGRA